VKECYDTREEMSVTNEPTSSVEWNIPMLNGREHMQDMDTRRMFPLGVKGVKLQRINGRHCLANAENCWGNRLIMRKW
jgi:hypothetical protein